jgi:ATP-dependent RNA helicase DDX35
MGEGSSGALGEIERRKFTAEEGDHLTLLNVYNAFTRIGGQSPKFCSSHRLNFKALSRAVAIRKQLKKYLERFGVKVESCQGDIIRLRKCLVTGWYRMQQECYRTERIVASVRTR